MTSSSTDCNSTLMNHEQHLSVSFFNRTPTASISNQTCHQSTSTPSTPVSTTIMQAAGQGSQHMPVFINMPFMMNPTVIPTTQYKDMNGNDISSSCVMKAGAMQMPPGIMVPQMTANLNNGATQGPSFFMASNPCTTAEQDLQQQQMHTPQMMPTLIQPAMVMPFRNQGAIFCMPQFPMMPQLQGTAMLSMQPTGELQTENTIST